MFHPYKACSVDLTETGTSPDADAACASEANLFVLINPTASLEKTNEEPATNLRFCLG